MLNNMVQKIVSFVLAGMMVFSSISPIYAETFEQPSIDMTSEAVSDKDDIDMTQNIDMTDTMNSSVTNQHTYADKTVYATLQDLKIEASGSMPNHTYMTIEEDMELFEQAIHSEIGHIIQTFDLTLHYPDSSECLPAGDIVLVARGDTIENLLRDDTKEIHIYQNTTNGLQPVEFEVLASGRGCTR